MYLGFEIGKACNALGTPKQVMTAADTSETIAPRADLAPLYDEAFQSCRALYPAMGQDRA